jgi:Zn-dependent M16 (insulinase) family peptidase
MNSGFDERIDDFVSFAGDLISRSCVRTGAYISVTDSVPADMSRFISMLPEGAERQKTAEYRSSLPVSLGIQVPASVSHSVMAYDLGEAGISAEGSMSVAANILSLGYLWNEIRVKGGAYGASVNASRTGSFFCYSYRDPSPARSLDIYKTTPDFLDAFAGAEDVDVSGFIISTIASTEPLVSPASKGRAADDFWFSGFTDEDRIRVRREILETTPEELRSWHDAFAGLAADGTVCVIGPKSALESCPDLEIIDI